MVISYYGLSCFKIDSKGTVIAVNPFSKEPGLSAPYFEAKIVLATKEAYRQSSISNNPFLISGPGEYDVFGISIKGIACSPQETAYLIEAEDMRLLHTGEFDAPPKDLAGLSRVLAEEVGRVDILFIPVGDHLGPEKALALAKDIDPGILVPMQFFFKGTSKKLGSVEQFLKEAGEKPRREERLTVKKKDIPTEEWDIVVLG